MKRDLSSNENRRCFRLYSSREPSDTTCWVCTKDRGHAGEHRTVDGDTWNTGDAHDVSNEEFWATMLSNGQKEMLDEQNEK